MSTVKQEFTEKELLKLKEDLGGGYAKKIQSILKDQYPDRKPYSIAYIYKGLTFEHASEKVIMAALVLKKKRREIMNELLTP